ncbi:GDSL-type esterase/lipase family protein [Aestuariibaculum sp. M13]|uniref:GDSL-type esterase/lipase family protein n=1 Tax=Aestuariibaculum sp. M13 TaxID=2967132 RepID=UPI002159CC6A|nr:GDSL-type esterase/lipase family protein [Aestuariibaculum sp. M13]MCR8668703.1 GDSL-type esterase/lipase family protein [Aestuariibaculum sp. M13]
MFSKFICLILILQTFIIHSQKIKVACVGNSVTYGYNIENREENCYPSQLQNLLGHQYEVGNFGHSGATLLKNGHKPYWDKKEFTESKEFLPNIVVIHLGLNDQGNNNWPDHKGEFIDDYLDMISTYQNLPTNPKVFICRMSPTFSGHHWFEEGMRESFKEIQSKIENVAKIANVSLIDLHEPLYRYPEYFPDNLHPTKEGATILAQKVYQAIAKDYGGLKVSNLYGENMVFQRNEPVVVTGVSNPDDEITVVLNTTKLVTKPDENGIWKAIFQAMEAGGPYRLKIESKLYDNIEISKVYIGEVWLASGQSNMDFQVSQMQFSETVLKDSINPNVFVFSMDPKVLKSTAFTREELALCRANNYFEYSGWTNSDGDILKKFSAVAYAYACNLQKKLNVPVGVVCNAVGGSTTQSWISRKSMEQTHETISLLNDTWFNPLVDTWVSERKSQNFRGDKFLKTRHPYDATFLFDSGILPLSSYNFKGVIWYQGESNTNHIALHSRLFRMLVTDWRTHFNKSDLPFYYVQLSSINRPNWGDFRDEQRKLLSIPNTGMVVSLDVGDKTDVHPKKKWVVGTRLANVALAKTYKKSISFSGPLFDYVNVLDDKLKVAFKYSSVLKTIDGFPVKDLEIAGEDKLFVKAQSKIEKNLLILWSTEIKDPRYVRYGYTSFSEGNLTNASGLPTSTFSNITN